MNHQKSYNKSVKKKQRKLQLNIYIQLQGKGSYFPSSRRLIPNTTHIEMKTALKIKKQEKKK